MANNGNQKNEQAASATDWNKRAGPVFKYGLAVGFALILLGGLSLGFSWTNRTLEMLVVCAGLGILFGAFGSTATIKVPIQGATLAGVAAIAVALFYVLLSQLGDRYVRVQLRGSDVVDAQVEFIGDQPYLGAYREKQRTHEFVIFSNEIRQPRLSLLITLSDDTEFFFECIDAAVLRPHLASGETILWEFSPPDEDNASDTPKIFDVASNRFVVENIGGCNAPSNRSWARASESEPSRSGSLFDLVPKAFAESGGASGAEIEKLLAALESNASHVRRNARTDLGAMGTVIVKPLLAAIAKPRVSYRTRLGTIVALTEMMRDNKKKRKEIIAMIGADDLERLVDASADEDRTIRIYASEFLFDLGDPQAIDMALEKFDRSSENGRYNLLLVVKGAVPYASSDVQTATASKVTALKADDTLKTNKLIDSIVALAKQG